MFSLYLVRPTLTSDSGLLIVDSVMTAAAEFLLIFHNHTNYGNITMT